MLIKLDSYMWKDELRTLSHSIYKTNSEWFKDLDLTVICETNKLIEENISTPPFDVNHSDFFFKSLSKSKETEAKINKWVLIKLTSFWPRVCYIEWSKLEREKTNMSMYIWNLENGINEPICRGGLETQI